MSPRPQLSAAHVLREALFAMFRSPFLPFQRIGAGTVGISKRAPDQITAELTAFYARRPRPWRYYGNNARRGRRAHR